MSADLGSLHGGESKIFARVPNFKASCRVVRKSTATQPKMFVATLITQSRVKGDPKSLSIYHQQGVPDDRVGGRLDPTLIDE